MGDVGEYAGDVGLQARVGDRQGMRVGWVCWWRAGCGFERWQHAATREQACRGALPPPPQPRLVVQTAFAHLYAGDVGEYAGDVGLQGQG